MCLCVHVCVSVCTRQCVGVYMAMCLCILSVCKCLCVHVSVLYYNHSVHDTISLIMFRMQQQRVSENMVLVLVVLEDSMEPSVSVV